MFGTHDFRRGHAKDLQESGAPLAVILAAGEWRAAERALRRSSLAKSSVQICPDSWLLHIDCQSRSRRDKGDARASVGRRNSDCRTALRGTAWHCVALCCLPTC